MDKDLKDFLKLYIFNIICYNIVVSIIEGRSNMELVGEILISIIVTGVTSLLIWYFKVGNLPEKVNEKLGTTNESGSITNQLEKN